MSGSSRLLFYLIRLLMGRGDHVKSLIARTRRQKLRVVVGEGAGVEEMEQGRLCIHPLDCSARGLRPMSAVQVSISTAHEREVVRWMRVECSRRVRFGQCEMGRVDAFNVEAAVAGAEEQATWSVRLPPREKTPPLPSHADSIRLAPVRQWSVRESGREGEELKKHFALPRILSNNDVIRIQVRDFFGDTQTHYYKVEMSDSPRVVTTSCSVYQTHSVNASLPLPLPTPLAAPVRAVATQIAGWARVYGKLSPRAPSPLGIVVSGAAGSGKRLAATAAAHMTGVQCVEIDCLSTWSEVSAQQEQKIKNAVEKASAFSPCLLYFSNADVIGFDPMSSHIDFRVASALETAVCGLEGVTVVFACKSDKLSTFSPSLRQLCLYDVNIKYLEESDRLSFFRHSLDRETAVHVARHTAGFSLAELTDLLKDARFHAWQNKRSSPSLSDLDWAIDRRNATFADAIGAPKIPSVSWSEVGGLEEPKATIKESIEAALHGSRSLRRSGVVMFGPPGCGKTLIAKAVATEYKIAFLSVKGPELLNKYVGQSEENLRKVFERARQAAPCVIFFDELDSLAPNRGKNGDSGGVMDRIVSSLISELDILLRSPHKVFVMAATNRADLLDPALLSPGRFDKVVNISPGQDVDSKAKILSAVGKKVPKEEGVDWRAVASHCPEVASGAQLFSLVSTATMQALKEQIVLIERGEKREEEADVRLAMRHLITAAQAMRG